MKSHIYILACFILLSCSEFSPNKYQVESTKRNLECYERLIYELNSNDSLRDKLIEVRNAKIRGDSDSISVELEYRLLSQKEIQDILPTRWKSECLEKLNEDDDFRGLRYVNEGLIIIEIDEFNRHTLSERYSRYKKVEIHRLIVSKKKVENRSFRLGGEKTKFTENLKNGWTYEITQVDSH